MPSPNLRPRPQRDTVATAPEPLDMKQKAEKEFASAFADHAPDENIVQQELKNSGKRK